MYLWDKTLTLIVHLKTTDIIWYHTLIYMVAVHCAHKSSEASISVSLLEISLVVLNCFTVSRKALNVRAVEEHMKYSGNYNLNLLPLGIYLQLFHAV